MRGRVSDFGGLGAAPGEDGAFGGLGAVLVAPGFTALVPPGLMARFTAGLGALFVPDLGGVLAPGFGALFVGGWAGAGACAAGFGGKSSFWSARNFSLSLPLMATRITSSQMGRAARAPVSLSPSDWRLS